MQSHAIAIQEVMLCDIPIYNERSWAIDLISEINSYTASVQRFIHRAGGEYTLHETKGKLLFPDVLLFGDNKGTVVQQGWELKMPDTPISDPDLISNAESKARLLGVNSFLLWNGNDAVLYKKDSSDRFHPFFSWPSLGFKSRAQLHKNKPLWVSRMKEILDFVNDMLSSGSLTLSHPAYLMSENWFAEFLTAYTPSLSAHIRDYCNKNATKAAELEEWWLTRKSELINESIWDGLSKTILISWVNRFLFAHYLKRFHLKASLVDSIRDQTSISEAMTVFGTISRFCDFMNVFRPSTGYDLIDTRSWQALIEFNMLLTEVRIETIDHSVLQNALDSLIDYSAKRMVGQFATPKPLADLLVLLTIEDRTKPVLDPCCGSGTIVKSVYALKRTLGISPKECFQNIWCSDKYSFPLQLCSISLSDPAGMGNAIQAFKYDALLLKPNVTVTFPDPNSDRDQSRSLPKLHAIVSNLPFIKQQSDQTFKTLSSKEVLSSYAKAYNLSGRSDIYAYLVLSFIDMLSDSGRVGVIISNSWLGAEWGGAFRKALLNNFKILRVVISGSGKWFDSSDVVSTLLVLEKRSGQFVAPSNEEKITFASVYKPIKEWNQLGYFPSDIARTILNNKTSPVVYSNSYSLSQVKDFEAMGLCWNTLFSDLSWLDELKPYLIPAHNLFKISRGERRGWDSLYYPPLDSIIEPEFLKPALLSTHSLKTLLATPDGVAFSCCMTLEDLELHNKSGAIAWIKRFALARNGKGKLLKDVLRHTNMEWYEFKPSCDADFVLSMNPDKRLAVYRLNHRAVVNQRLISLSAASNTKVDYDLTHALFNSSIGLFFLEAAGFGRGLGALDLNATKIASSYQILNPDLFSISSRNEIIGIFKTIIDRKLLELPEELQTKERLLLDQSICSALGIPALAPVVRSELIRLFNRRHSVSI